jgi:hypothetical protein
MMVFLVIALGAAFLFARRAHNRETRDAILFATALLLVAFASLSRVVGERWPYLFTWRYAVVWFIIGVLIVAIASLARRPMPAFAKSFRWAALAFAVSLFGFAVVVKVVHTPYGQILPFERATEKLAAQIDAADLRSQPVQLVHVDGFVHGVGDGLMNKLDEEGWRVGAEPGLVYKYGSGRAVSPKSSNGLWYVTETSAGTTLTESVPGARVVAMVTPLSGDEERELTRLQRQFIARMRETKHMELLPAVDYELVALATYGRMDTRGIDMNRMGELNGKVARSASCRCAVVIEPPGTPRNTIGLAASIPASAIQRWAASSR